MPFNYFFNGPNPGIQGDGNTIFVGEFSSIVSINGANGSVQWASDVASVGANPRFLMYKNSMLYASTNLGLVRLDPKTGKALWHTLLVWQIVGVVDVT